MGYLWVKQSNKLPGPIDEARERFCLLLILRQMASSEDSENQHLSHLYKCLAAEVDEKKRLGAFSSVGSQLLQGWIWLVLANVRWRWWQPIRDHCFSGRVSLTATNITRPTLYFIEEIYQFLCTVSVFVHRTRITFDRRGDCGLRERRRERRDRGLRERRRDRSFALKKKKASRASRKHNARMC